MQTPKTPQNTENQQRELEAKMVSDEKDAELAVRMARGDRDAAGEFYKRFGEPIYRFIYFKVATREIAQDLASACFLKVLEQFARGLQVENIRAYLYRTARNIVIDYYRKSGRAQVIEYAEETVGSNEGPLEINERVDLQLASERLVLSLRKIKDEWREVLVLRYIEGYSNQEIAAMLQKSEGAVRVLIHRALQELRRTINHQEFHD